MDPKYLQLADRLARAKNTIALTGAGISVESGIPAFRGSQGLWAEYDPMEYAHIQSFHNNPGKVWRMLKELDTLLVRAKPNPAHTALAELESMGLLKCIITQNVDSLHQEAGSKQDVEFHGNGKMLVCLDGGRKYSNRDIPLDTLPPRCECMGVLKPDVVFFGETIPYEASTQAQTAAYSCDLIMVIGTSAVVAPASMIPVTAKNHGAYVVEINLEPTVLSQTISDLVINESASRVLPEVVTWLKSRGK
ncbi:MAG: NAD-dependent deacylase [Deltaproteobacteria bacterium]|nr:NAD-dependent deacylase [Deltaproteobacteria bacterium]